MTLNAQVYIFKTYTEKKSLKRPRFIDTKKTKKIAYDSQIDKAKDNLKLSYSGPGQRQASGINQRIKALRQGCQ